MVLFVHNFYLTLRISNLDNMINSLTEEIAVRDYYKKEEENEVNKLLTIACHKYVSSETLKKIILFGI